VAEILEVIATKFRGKCITTNIVRQKFSTLKSNIKFKGKRSITRWKSILNFYFTVREYPELVNEIIERLKFRKKLVGRIMGLVLNIIERR